jgi:hypothetical protein
MLFNSDQRKQLCECNQCGYRWVSSRIPEQCPNQKCRSRKWNFLGPVSLRGQRTSVWQEKARESVVSDIVERYCLLTRTKDRQRVAIMRRKALLKE